jgi:dimethylamine monooxygenase subunit C
MLVQGIKSRPVYKGVTADPNAARHLFVLEGEGALALLEQSATLSKDILGKTEILYVAAGSKPKDYGRKLAGLGAGDYWEAPSVPVLLNRLNVMLGQAKMGLRIYIAGTEGFIGQAVLVALNHGVDHNSIPTEHRGSEARRVQCVHCKGITENVKTSPYSCSHCGLPLLVRDHYSRRIGAFQGVSIDAEEPGTAPPPEELFP